MLHYRVDPALLTARVPRGTTFDTWNGFAHVSLVAFLFQRSRVGGIPIPFHGDFEEINLRFYTRRETGRDTRHGVCFIREVVGKSLISISAQLSYNEPYLTLPTRHELSCDDAGEPRRIAYEWEWKDAWQRMEAEMAGTAQPIEPGSELEFVTMRYWGHTQQRDGGTIEYQVRHPAWKAWKVTASSISADLAPIYGEDLAAAISRPPDLAGFIDGSGVTLSLPQRLH